MEKQRTYSHLTELLRAFQSVALISLGDAPPAGSCVRYPVVPTLPWPMLSPRWTVPDVMGPHRPSRTPHFKVDQIDAISMDE